MCGIFGIYSNNTSGNNLAILIKCLKSLQHRGKDGFGMVLLDNNKFKLQKQEGMIRNKKIPLIQTKSCIGHLRYSTSGYSAKTGKLKMIELQPLRGKLPDYQYFIAHNGNIPNIEGHDTRFLNQEIMRQNQTMSMGRRLIRLMMNVPAAYCLLILTPTALYAVRDRYGIRPLCLGKDKNNYYVSSESCAFHNIDYIRDIKQGEIIKIDKNGVKSLFIHPTPQFSLCSFEILYFLNENSFVDGLHIKNIRKNLGRKLAKKEKYIHKNSDYIVIGIPETGICSGKAYAAYLNLKYEQAIRKKSNKGRTFIILDEKKRKIACDQKFTYDLEKIYDKKIIIVDDTIVRGNIIKSIIKHLKRCGVREIHIRIPAPPVIDICELGIAIQHKTELLLDGKSIKDVQKELKVNSLVFLTIDELEYFPKKSYNQCFTEYIEPTIKNFQSTVVF